MAAHPEHMRGPLTDSFHGAEALADNFRAHLFIKQ
jgi:hypothetical protein